jgi:peptidyl-dipeptidase Dcp
MSSEPTYSTAAQADASGAARPNPFLAASTLPYQLPPFASITPADYRPAFERGMAEQLAEIDAIAANPEAPTFDNTLIPLELSGRVLDRVSKVFYNLSSSDTSPELEEIEAEISPLLAAHSDAIHLDGALFGRIKALYEARASLELPEPAAESLRLVEKYHQEFVRAGAELSGADQSRLRELNAERATLSTTFQRNLLADTKARALVLEDAAALAGLSPDAVAAAAENGRALGHEDAYVLSLKLFSNQTELASLTDRDVRRRLLEASTGRGFAVNAEIIRRLVTLRAERAALLGYESHAAYAVADQTARTVADVEEMLARLVPPAVANARREAESLRAANGGAAIEAWDWQYYSEQVRKAEYDLDTAAFRPYLELERVLHDGVFFAAGKVYGLTFTPRPDLPAYHPDARVFEVFNEDGSGLGLFIADFYARASKRGGAWMNELVDQSRCSARGRSSSTTSTSPSPRPASRRC